MRERGKPRKSLAYASGSQQLLKDHSMPKRDPVQEALARLTALKSADDPAVLAEGLAPLLADKSSYVVSRAAELAGERSVRTALPQIIQIFERLLNAASAKDVG